jgi:hypothetical protein
MGSGSKVLFLLFAMLEPPGPQTSKQLLQKKKKIQR